MHISSFKCVVILSFLLVNCSDKSPIEPDYEFFIGVYDVLIELDEHSVSVSTVNEISTSNFQLNGVEVPLNWEYSEYLNECNSYIRKAELDSSIEYSLGKDYNIYLELNGKEYNSSIHLSDKPIVTWPELNIQSNFIFAWELEDVPFQQTVYMDILYDDGFFDKYWHLDGDKRSLTIQKKFLEKQKEPGSILWVNLSCYNKVQNGKFITIATSINCFK